MSDKVNYCKAPTDVVCSKWRKNKDGTMICTLPKHLAHNRTCKYHPVKFDKKIHKEVKR